MNYLLMGTFILSRRKLSYQLLLNLRGTQFVKNSWVVEANFFPEHFFMPFQNCKCRVFRLFESLYQSKKINTLSRSFPYIRTASAPETQLYFGAQ